MFEIKYAEKHGTEYKEKIKDHVYGYFNLHQKTERKTVITTEELFKNYVSNDFHCHILHKADDTMPGTVCISKASWQRWLLKPMLMTLQYCSSLSDSF